MASPHPSTAPRFGPYELERRLGAGGMAETFVAVRRGPGGFEQRVCLKRILPAFEEDAEFVRLFLEEARVSARLRHTNIVQVLDFGVVDGSHFLALELVEGLDMRGVLDQLGQHGEALPAALVALIAIELGTALDVAHEAEPDGTVRGVVHRDISPSNVLLSNAGEVKLTDFGIAKAMNTAHVTRSGTIKGKVPYMAPEYALQAVYDARSDLFALGVTLYESIAGRRPFDGVTEIDTMRRIQEGIHVPIQEAAPGTPRILADSIERLLRSDPNERFSNAADFLDSLIDVAPPPTARRMLGELVRRCAERKRAKAKPKPLPAPPAPVQATAVVAPPQPAAPSRVAGPTGEMRGQAADGEAAREDLTPFASPVDRTGALPRRAMPVWMWALGGIAIALVSGAGAWIAATAGSGEEHARPLSAASEPAAAPAPATAPPPAPALPIAEPEPPVAPEPEPEPEAAAGPETSAEPETSGEERRSRRRRSREARVATVAMRENAEPRGRGTLSVVVIPFGDVWVDGRRIGSAPVEVEVSAGRHVVGTGERGSAKRVTVQVASGQRRRVVLR